AALRLSAPAGRTEKSRKFPQRTASLWVGRALVPPGAAFVRLRESFSRWTAPWGRSVLPSLPDRRHRELVTVSGNERSRNGDHEPAQCRSWLDCLAGRE